MIKAFVVLLSLVMTGLLANPNTLFAAENYIDITVWQDTYIPENPPYKGYYAKRDLTLGYSPENNEGKHRTYFKYLLPELEENAIETDDIMSVDLVLYQINNNALAPYIVKPYGVDTLNWFDDAITWATQPGLIDFGFTDQVYKTTEGEVAIDVGEIVISQLNENKTDNGLAILMDTESLPGGRFFSIECVYQLVEPLCLPEMRPKLRFYLNEQFIETPVALESQKHSNKVPTILEWEDARSRETRIVVYRDELLTEATFQSEWKEQTSESVTLEEGKYYWLIQSRSNGIVSISDTNTLTIDLAAPPTPEISDIFIPSGKNLAEVSVISQEDDAKLYLRYSQSETFEQYEEISTSLPIAILNQLPEGVVYFQAKLEDLAGNQSEWSDAVIGIVDTIPPKFKTLLIEPEDISPGISDGIQDTLNIKVEVEEENFNELLVKISELNGETVFQETFTSKNVSLTWPERKDLAEGDYLISIEATDETGQDVQNFVKMITIDNTVPTPVGVRLVEVTDDITNSHELTLQFERTPEELSELHLNSELLDFEPRKKVTVPLFSEGENSLLLIYQDKAGNQSTATYNFTVDWSPPLTPDINIIPDYYDKSLEVEVLNNDSAKAYVYSNAELVEEIDLTNSKKKLVVEKWEPQKEYDLTIVTEDDAGNMSEPSPSKVFLSPEDELGIGNGYEGRLSEIKTAGSCKYDLNESTGKIFKTSCNIKAPTLKSAGSYKTSNGNYHVSITGESLPYLKIEISTYRCQNRTLFNLKTLFSCVLKFQKRESFIVKASGAKIALLGGKRLATEEVKTSSTKAFTANFTASSNPGGKLLSIYTENIFSIKYGRGNWIDFSENSSRSKNIKITAQKTSRLENRKLPFSFPFKKLIGVTQWYGRTAYQRMHQGIDFGAFKDSVISPADGIIESIGWDNFMGKCNSGGNYLKIKHNNGMYSVYFHLEKYASTKNKRLQVGDRIKKGQEIGTSGNTGAYNCQPLGYHLHFELRKESWQQSSVDPVKWISVNWDQIPTLGAKYHPGRLTGNNPHPGR